MIKKKTRTIFSTPIISHILRLFSFLLLKVTGWRTVGEPAKLDKYVLIGLPHTSNWDFALMLPVMLKYKVDLHWIGKHTLFPKPVGWLMRWLGGIPIDRSSSHGTVEQAAAAFANSPELVLLITPEGTRKKVERLKEGFYHIARAAGVPLQLGFVDVATKTCGFGPVLELTGDYEVDLAKMREFYADKRGINAENDFSW